MAITQNTYTGNGSTVLYSFAFPYLNTADVKVSINGTITTAYTFANATTIQFNTAPANGAAIRIYRETNDASLQAVLSPGSSIRASDLNDNFDQLIYLGQEANTEADSATATANTALTNSATAISTANTASTNASAAVSTANTASANASAAVTTANTASTNASNAVSTANTASTNATTALNTANSATTTANNATSTANTALSTANTALTNANAAVSTANTASTNANNAVSTANTASTNATNAVNTANTASTNATTAVNTANSAVTTANAAAAAVANAVLYTTVANVAAIPGSPANNAAVEVTNSTGIESFTPLSGLPAGFVGSSGLSVRLIYQTAGATWTWIQYFPNDPETRYFKLSGGTITGPITVPQGTVSSPGVKFSGTGNDNTGVYSPGIDELGLVTNGVSRLSIDSAGAVSIPGTLGVTGAITGSLTGSASNNVLKAGDTMTGALGVTAGTAGAPSVFISGDTNTGLYSPGADQVAISTGGSGRLFVDASGNVGIGGTPGLYTKLAVNGNIYGANGSQFGWVTAFSNAPTDFIDGSQSSNYIRFFTNNAERMRLDSSGRLGVGTSTPVTRLHVVNDGGTSPEAVVRFRDTNSTARTTRIQLQDYLGTLADGLIDFKIPTAGSAASAIMQLGVNSAAITIDSSQRVGIGTSSPSSTAGGVDISSGGIGLVVGADGSVSTRTNATDKIFRIGSAHYTNAEEPVCIAFGQNLSSDNELNFGGGSAALNAATYMRFFTAANNTTTSGTERMRIDSSGRVGIGTTSPRSKFDVSGDVYVSGGNQIQITGTPGGTGLQLIGQDAAESLIGTMGSQALAFRTASSERARIDSSGRLLVGTTSWSDSEKLVLRGNANNDDEAFLSLVRGSAPANGQNLGVIIFHGNGSATESARISALRDGGTWNAGSSRPSRLTFSTTADGASSPTERMRIDSSGVVKFTTQTVQIGGGTNQNIFRSGADGSGIHFTTNGTVPTNETGNISDNTETWGNAGYRWSVIYAATGTINTSDANEKQDIQDLSAAELAVAKELKNLFKTFKWKNAVAEKGDNARIHVGVIAQDVQQLFADHGLDVTKYGLWCSDTWYEVDGIGVDSNGIPYKADSEGATARTRLGIRYDELLAFVLAAL